MQCERCKKQKATVFLTQIINGKMHKVDLCESCAKEMGVTNVTGFSLADLLLNIGSEQKQENFEQHVDQETCSACGMTLDEIKKTGRLGCPECYQVFADTISTIIGEVQKAPIHKGKIPLRQNRSELKKENIEELQREMEQAIREEQFEKAAALRDQIRRLRDSN